MNQSEIHSLFHKLDKIIELLELRNSINQGRLELTRGVDYVSHDKVFCICHMKGKTSAVEICPIHG